MAEEIRVENAGIAYIANYGVISRTLEKIIQASVPERFTQDFLATKLAVKGGTAKAVIPFMKRTGFLNSDGTPTDLYQEFRNDNARGSAAARALKKGFSTLYEMNEYVHDLGDSEFKGLVVQATGAAPTASTVKSVVGSFKALKAFASFDGTEAEEGDLSVSNGSFDMPDEKPSAKVTNTPQGNVDLRLGYTINLNLPATTDIAVYNAVFKSLKEHLLDQ